MQYFPPTNYISGPFKALKNLNSGKNRRSPTPVLSPEITSHGGLGLYKFLINQMIRINSITDSFTLAANESLNLVKGQYLERERERERGREREGERERKREREGVSEREREEEREREGVREREREGGRERGRERGREEEREGREREKGREEEREREGGRE